MPPEKTQYTLCCAENADQCRTCRMFRTIPTTHELLGELLMLVHAAQHDRKGGAPGDTPDMRLAPTAKRAYATYKRVLGLPQ